MLSFIKDELQKDLENARVSQVYMPSKDELVLVFRTFTENKKLLLCTRADTPRVGFIEKSIENPKQPPMLCMLLRKRLAGAKLIEISQQSFERVLFFKFKATNEVGDSEILTLCIEIMGRYSNVILLDCDNNVIDSLKRVDISMSQKRLVLPKMPYEPVPPQDKLSLLSANTDEIVKKIKSMPYALDKSILSSIEGISPIICREIEYKTAISKDDFDTALYNEIEKIKEIIKEKKPIANIVVIDSLPFDTAFIDVSQYGTKAQNMHFDSFSKMLEFFYGERDRKARMKAKSLTLSKLLSNAVVRLTKKLNLQRAELSQCKDRELLRMYGDLLQANLYRIKRGDKAVTVENFYDGNKELTIPLKETLSPAGNAGYYYKEYNRAKTREKMLTTQIEKAIEELEYIESVQFELANATCEKDLSQIREELIEGGYIKPQKGEKLQNTSQPPFEFTSKDGVKIYVGRNNRQNDLLTLKTAHKSDMWFHTKNIPGSHVIAVTNGQNLSESTIIEAAQAAAFHSKAKNSSQVPVDYTLVKYVSKPSGAKPGLVIYTHNKTVFVTPKDFKTE